MSEPPGNRTEHRYGETVRRLFRACDHVSLGTLDAAGRAYVSLAAVATDIDGAPLLLFSRLSDHTRNIERDAQVSLLFDGTAGFANPQEGPRVTIMGRAMPIAADGVAQARRRFLARHPGAALYAGFADFAFHRLEIERVHFVGGFGKAAWIETPVLVPEAAAERFARAEPELLARFARRADAIAKRLGRRSKGWQLTALDPDGGIVVRGEQAIRFAFPEPLADPKEFDAALRRAVHAAM